MTAMATPRHRVSAATAQMRAAADAVADASVWSMDPAETASTLVEHAIQPVSERDGLVLVLNTAQLASTLFGTTERAQHAA